MTHCENSNHSTKNHIRYRSLNKREKKKKKRKSGKIVTYIEKNERNVR